MAKKSFLQHKKERLCSSTSKKGFSTSAEKVMRRGAKHIVAKQSFADGPKVKRGSKLCTSCCWHWTMAVSNSFDQAGRHSRQKTMGSGCSQGSRKRNGKITLGMGDHNFWILGSLFLKTEHVGLKGGTLVVAIHVF